MQSAEFYQRIRNIQTWDQYLAELRTYPQVNGGLEVISNLGAHGYVLRRGDKAYKRDSNPITATLKVFQLLQEFYIMLAGNEREIPMAQAYRLVSTSKKPGKFWLTIEMSYIDHEAQGWIGNDKKHYEARSKEAINRALKKARSAGFEVGHDYDRNGNLGWDLENERIVFFDLVNWRIRDQPGLLESMSDELRKIGEKV